MSNNTSIEAIIFDLGRVLLAIDNTLLVEHLFKGLGTGDIQELARRTMSNPAMVDFNTGRIDAKTFYNRMRQTYHWGIDFDTFKKLWCRIFYPMEGIEELIMQIRGSVKLGLLSDTDPLHWKHIITTWPWIGMFENPTLSYQLGVMKPAPAIYNKAAENLSTPPAKCLYIDDLQDNVDGAIRSGMQAVRFENIQQLKKIFHCFQIL